MLGQPLQLMIKSVSGDGRVIKVTMAKEEITNAVVRTERMIDLYCVLYRCKDD